VPNEELRLKTIVEGADKAAADLGKVDAAQGKVTDSTKKATGPTEALTEGQVKLNAAEGDYIGLLSRANPALGAVADGLLKFVKIGNTAADTQINIAEVTKKATAALRANAGAVKLVAGAAVAAAAVVVLYKAYHVLTDELKGNTNALNAETAATRTSREEHEKSLKAIQDVANQRELMAKLGRAEAQEIKAQADGIAARTGLLAESVAQVAALYEGSGLATKQIEDLAAAWTVLGGKERELITPRPGMRGRELGILAETGLADPTVQAAVTKARGEGLANLRGQAQRLQAGLAAGGTPETDAALKARGFSDAQIKQANEGYRFAGASEEVLRGAGISRSLSGRIAVERQFGREDLTPVGAALDQFGFGGAQLGGAFGGGGGEALLQNMLSYLEELTAIARRGRGGQQASIIVNNGPDAGAMADRSVQPQTIRDNVEGG